ncbi:MAG: hypothetical protein M3460_04065 [Actinomycetota bacterium]|nr:hypothetical protein [Actinomycetota bacterium]
MTLIDLSQLRQVLETTSRDLFRWETLPAYEVASDGTDYHRYLEGADAPTPERKQPWLDTLRAWAEQGRSRRRVRIIHDPITDYERYACEWGYALNSQAGEIIRIIDLAETQLPPQLTGIGGDFWLIDGREVVAMHYQPDGQFHAAEILGPQRVSEYRMAAEVAWESGIDFVTWWNDHPQHHRSAHRVA